jgi:FlaA1/EpsC-like NDP-sugar epimerase
MISEEDSYSTYEYTGHYKILPAINSWSNDQERIKDGKQVPEGFVYTSDNNLDWLSVSGLQAWIEENKNKIGKI